MRDIQEQISDVSGLVSKLVKEAYEKGYEDGLYARDKTLLPPLPYGLSYDDDITCLELSTRAHNCLKRGGINTIKDLAETTQGDIRKIRNIGLKTVEDTLAILHVKYGIYLKGEAKHDHRKSEGAD